MGETGKGRAIFLREPLAILTPDGVDARGGLLVRDGVIEQVFAPGATPAGDVETVDISRHVVLPGLINTHHHFYQTLTRAHPAAINRELFDWLTALYPLWARLTPDHLRIATRLALTELMLSGVTCASDHHYVFPEGLDAAMDIQAEEAAALGIRIVLNRGSMNLSVRDGGRPTASCRTPTRSSPTANA